jgi:serine/threonine protein kinase
MPLHHEFNTQGSIAHPNSASRGDYIINQNHTLGKGATSTVKMAQHSRTSERAVVKMVNLPIHSRYFDQELQALSILNHKNIVKLYDYDENNGYLFLEYIPYPSLYDFIQNCGPLSEKAAFKILYQMVDAFLYIHSLGISHQDFKPENVCYNPYTQDIKILDFGLSVTDEDQSTHWHGSPLYMAPEVHAKKPYDRYKADIWSLGVSFYEMVTGDTPFTDCEDLDDLTHRLIDETDPIPVPDNVSSAASFLLKRMLNRDPRERISLALVMDLIRQQFIGFTES